METNTSSREGNIKTVKFNGKNFAIWKYSLFIRLREHNLISMVEGSRLNPVEENKNKNKAKYTAHY